MSRPPCGSDSLGVYYFPLRHLRTPPRARRRPCPMGDWQHNTVGSACCRVRQPHRDKTHALPRSRLVTLFVIICRGSGAPRAVPRHHGESPANTGCEPCDPQCDSASDGAARRLEHLGFPRDSGGDSHGVPTPATTLRGCCCSAPVPRASGGTHSSPGADLPSRGKPGLPQSRDTDELCRALLSPSHVEHLFADTEDIYHQPLHQ